MGTVFAVFIAAQYLVSFIRVDFLRQAGLGFFAAAAAVLAIAVFVFWSQRERWAGWLCPRYLQAGNPDTNEATVITALFGLELLYLTGAFLLPHTLHPELSMGKTDLYIALTAEVCMILLLFLSRLDVAFAGEKKPTSWYWRILPVSTFMIAGVLLHHRNPFWPQDPWKWAQNMVLIFLAELACNLGIRCWLAKRKLAGKLRRAAGKRVKQFWSWLGTGILIFIVVIEPLDLPGIMRIQLDNTGIFLSRAVFIAQLICILTFFLTRPLWLKWLMDRACGMGVVSAEAVSEGQITKGQLADHVQTAFLILCLLVFGNILPYFLYINGHLHKFAVMWMAWWAFDLWDYGFGSPLYLILTGAKEILPLRCRFPWLSCAAAVLLVWNFPFPYDMTRCAVLIICLFLLECTVLLVWIKWKKCFLWLKKRYQRAGFQLVEKNSSMLVGEIIWLGMEFYFLIFLYFVPGIFGISKFVDSVSAFFTFISIVLIVMTLCDTKLDVVFTGERTLPPLFLRVMPVSLVISALSVPVCWFAGEFGVKESAIAMGVMFFFFLEFTCNLGFRFFLRKKRENDGEKTPPAEGKILKLTAWKYLWAALVIAGPFLFGSWGSDPISLLLFALNTVCVLLLFWKQRNMREKICGYLIRAYDGVKDETEKADDVEENLTLQNPLYGFLTNTVGPTALRRRIPYVTISACVYALTVYPLPWTDSGRLSKLAAVGIVELVCTMALPFSGCNAG